MSTVVDEVEAGAYSFAATPLARRYDQYREYCYYLVQLYEKHAHVGELMAKVATDFIQEGCGELELRRELRDRIAEVAASGKANTDRHR